MEDLALTLKTSEAALLDEVLAAQLADLRFELARTDDRHYRASLRRRLDQLEIIAAHLTALLPHQPE